MKKIYIHLKGGLGNQLFQYAFYLNLINSGVVVDGFYETYKDDTYDRNLEINKILKMPIETIDSINSESVIIQSEDLNAILTFLESKNEGVFVLDGYFQQYEYVLNSKIENYLNLNIDQIPMTALHIRRSDYGHHGLLPLTYYMHALNLVENSDFYIFSDEFNFSNYFFSKVKGFKGVIKARKETSVSDFCSMISFKNIIMANSSYSWFASYLSSVCSSSKIIYPSDWSLIDQSSPGFNLNWLKVKTKLNQNW